LHYTIVEKLGEGGMGVVWKARDNHLDRFVALKVLPADKVTDAERMRRFVQEAKATSALNPSLCEDCVVELVHAL
jgi:serine/threonine protein kinase